MGITRRAALAFLGAGALGAARPPAGGMEPGVRTYELVAAPGHVELLGRRTALWLYGGRFPGPTLEAREGERLRLHFENRMPLPTNLHFHGMLVSPVGNGDNVYLEIPPGERFTYEIDIPPGEAGLYWYHPHYHGLLALQMWHGLSGPIVVRGPLDELPELRAFEELLLFVRDVEPEGPGLAPHRPRDWHKGKEGRYLLVNGRFEPVHRARRGGVRLRVVNACNARYLRLALSDRRPLHLIATDGHFLEQPVALEEYLLPPAARADFLIRFEDGRPIDLVALRYNRGVPSPPLANRFLLRLRPPEGLEVPALPGRLADIPRHDPETATVRRRITMSMFLLDGRSYRFDRIDVRGRLGDLELWRVENVGSMDHPFHLHTWYFQLYRRNGRPPPYRAWYDIVNLRAGDVVELLVPLRRFPGRTVYHCHIAEHGDRGMMGNIEVGAPGFEMPPPQWPAGCYAPRPPRPGAN